MFIQFTFTNILYNKGKTYPQYVKSYHNKRKQPATKVILNLGNISDMVEEQIGRLAKSFIKALKAEETGMKIRFSFLPI